MGEEKRIPFVKGWGLYFSQSDGLDNRRDVMEGFLNFLRDKSQNRFPVPGKCMLGGNVYKSKKIRIGSFTLTSNLIEIMRVMYFVAPGITEDILCAFTEHGGRYFIVPDDTGTYMYLLMKDMEEKGELNPRQGYYLPKEISEWNNDLL